MRPSGWSWASERERAHTIGSDHVSAPSIDFTQAGPERVEALALLSTDPGGAAAALAAPAVWAALTDHSGTPRQQASRVISLLFPPDLAPEIDRQFGELVADARAELSPQALSAQEAAMAAWHEEEQAPPESAAPPVLAAHGSEDLVIPPENLDALAARWPGCRVEASPAVDTRSWPRSPRGSPM